MTLEERIERLENIEAIRYLQAKYQRCLDSRDFDGLASCFHDDAESSYGSGKMSYKGKDAIVKFLCDVMRPSMPSTHLIHGGEIDIIDSKHAEAKWYLEDHLVHQKFLVKLHGAAIYEVKYEKVGDEWKIKKIGYDRCYQYVEARGPVNLATFKNKTIINKVKKADPTTLGEYGQYYQYETLKKKKKTK
ncbi:MAG: nuclear transport factor 2 family protein [Bacilli bacterium]|nr:nuclear transport factor 2 family protein [Bacilli bacterium]